MAKETKTPWTSFTKAELIKTVKQLNVRQTKLLNRIAELEQQRAVVALRLAQTPERDGMEAAEPQPIFPWSSAVALPNPFEEGE